MGFPKIIVTGPAVSKRVDECQKFPLVIGRATSSDIVVSDERASRAHARIDALPDGSYQRPVSAIVANFTRPGSGRPAPRSEASHWPTGRLRASGPDPG